MEEVPEIMRGVQYYIDEIRKAGLYEKIPPFNDVVTGKSKPHGAPSESAPAL